jgi:predicted nucleic acid-binding protein
VSREAVFLDTSGIYEAADRGGGRHPEAAAALRDLMESRAQLVTTDLVLAEVHGLTLGRLGPGIALSLLDRLLGSARLELISIDPGVRARAVDLLRTRPDRRISLTDAVSFVVMRDRGVEVALALDEDFNAEGFRTLPS